MWKSEARGVLQLGAVHPTIARARTRERRARLMAALITVVAWVSDAVAEHGQSLCRIVVPSRGEVVNVDTSVCIAVAVDKVGLAAAIGPDAGVELCVSIAGSTSCGPYDRSQAVVRFNAGMSSLWGAPPTAAVARAWLRLRGRVSAHACVAPCVCVCGGGGRRDLGERRCLGAAAAGR